jgi:hypothetical protein
MGAELKSPLNTYLLDFFRHGDKVALEKSNGVRRGDVWYLLNDFSLVLASIVASFENFLRQDDGSGDDMELDLTAIRGLADEAEIRKDAEEDEFFDSAASTDKADHGAMVSKEWKVDVKARKRSEVAESWDCEGSDASVDNDDERMVRFDSETRGDGDSEESEEQDVSGDEAGGFLMVLKMFKMLKLEFDAKFKKLFA